MEEKSLALRPTGELSTVIVTPEQKALVKSVIFPDATDDELSLFVFQCQRKGVHPLDRMIYPIKRNSKTGPPKLSFQAGIDFMRSEAEGTEEYDGQDEPEFEMENPDNSKWPSLARVKIYRKGVSRPFVGIARWDEYYPGELMGHMYRKMPFNQLAKCAEANGLRKAFPKVLGDLVCPEEMQQADTDPKEKALTRSASIKPAQAETQGKIVEGEQLPVEAEEAKNPLDEEITQLLGELFHGDWAEMAAGLESITSFPETDKTTKKPTGKIIAGIKLASLASATAAWKGKALSKLRAEKGKADALKAELEPNAGN